MVLGRFVFFVFWANPTSFHPADPDLDSTFYEQAKALANQPSSLAQPDTSSGFEEQVITGEPIWENTCAGWYDTQTISWGWVACHLIPSTGAGGKFGVQAVLNDGTQDPPRPGGQWFEHHWNVEGNLHVEVSYSTPEQDLPLPEQDLPPLSTVYNGSLHFYIDYYKS